MVNNRSHHDIRQHVRQILFLFFFIKTSDIFSFEFDLDEDDTYQYRHVILDKEMIPMIPKNRLMDECEWRTLGIKQGPHWEHYLIHKPGQLDECLS